METIRNYLNNIFSNMPDTPEVVRAKTDLLNMMEDKYNQLIAEGLSENEAIGTVIAEFGSLEEISEMLGIPLDQTKAVKLKEITLEDDKEYIRLNRQRAVMVALGVFLCIVSSAIPGFGEATNSILVEAVTMAAMFVVVAIAVGCFIMSGNPLKGYEDISKSKCVAGQEALGYAAEEEKEKSTRYCALLAIGVMLCVISVIPACISDFASNEWMETIGAMSVLIFTAIGVFFIVYQALAKKGWKKIQRNCR